MWSIEEESFLNMVAKAQMAEVMKAAEDVFQDAKSRGFFTDDIETLQDLMDAHNIDSMTQCWST